MKLYYHHFASPTVRKVRAVAFQLDLKLDEIKVDYDAREHLAPEYLALNPNAKFPTLVDGDLVLWESNAIAQYLASQVPAAGLLPLDDERARADLLRWQCWELSHFSPAAGRLIRLSMGDPVDGATRAEAEVEFRRYADVLERQLRARAFVLGPRLTIVDFALASMLMYAEEAALPLKGYHELTRWFAQVEREPGWRRSAPPSH